MYIRTAHRYWELPERRVPIGQQKVQWEKFHDLLHCRAISILFICLKFVKEEAVPHLKRGIS